MKTKQDIKFVASQSVSKLTAGKVCYQGQIIHNQTFSVDETRQRFAEYMHYPEPRTNLAIESICDFIVQELSHGNHIDFGPFSAGLKMRGGLTAANAPFDARKNALSIELIPGKALKKALSGLNPINATQTDRTEVSSTLQQLPNELRDTIVATGSRS